MQQMLVNLLLFLKNLYPAQRTPLHLLPSYHGLRRRIVVFTPLLGDQPMMHKSNNVVLAAQLAALKKKICNSSSWSSPTQ
jgi:hypothetical protein